MKATSLKYTHLDKKAIITGSTGVKYKGTITRSGISEDNDGAPGKFVKNKAGEKAKVINFMLDDFVILSTDSIEIIKK